MTRFLVTDDNPEGDKLEEVLSTIRNEIISRATKIMEDGRPEATSVLNNNIKILNLLSESIKLAEDSTRILQKSFGPHQVEVPRIGEL